MGLFGIWKGAASYWGPFGTIWAQEFEFRLHEDGNDSGRILGEGITAMPSFGALAKFDIEGMSSGSKLRAKSSNFKLITRYDGNHPEVVFNACRQFDFDLTFIERVQLKLDFIAIFNQQHYNLPYEADILRGTFNGVGMFDGMVGKPERSEGVCSTDNRNQLVRTPETIIVMFGGCRDGEHHAVLNGVYTPYVNKIKQNLRYGQYAKYFAYNHIKEAKLFIYNLLKVSPYAKIALVGHSLGGDATFRLARVLAEELPELKIDLIITLDPVTLKDDSHNERYHRRRLGESLPPENSRASIPSRPDNVFEWINVPIKPWSGKGNWFVETGGIQWRDQPEATNIITDFTHGDAGLMFTTKYTQLSNMTPQEKLSRLEGLAKRDGTRLLVKLNALLPAP